MTPNLRDKPVESPTTEGIWVEGLKDGEFYELQGVRKILFVAADRPGGSTLEAVFTPGREEAGLEVVTPNEEGLTYSAKSTGTRTLRVTVAVGQSTPKWMIVGRKS